MTTTIEYEPARTVRRQNSNTDKLRNTTTAVSVGIKWFGTRKSLSNLQKQEVAEPFNAEKKFISVGKKLFDTTHPDWKRLVALRGQIISDWKKSTLPYPVDGIRLIKRDDVDQFNVKMNDYRNQLDEAVFTFNSVFREIRNQAEAKLGRLFDLRDYPDSLIGLFDVTWNFTNVEPPEYLMLLSPTLYEQESIRVRQQFDEAVRLAEEAFAAELSKLVTHLAERLEPTEDGTPKVFRDTAITNFSDFFERFAHLDIGSNEELEEVVNEAKRIINRCSPQSLRSSVPLRNFVAGELERVKSSLDSVIVTRPRRNLIRHQK
ncbi:MAG: hypothetical protein ACRC2T_11720 [Thermoguttaceae bacterium]